MHPVPEQRVEGDRHETRRVSPELEQLALLIRERIDRVAAIDAQPRERRYVVRACEHVDRIDLKCVNSLGELPHVIDRWLRGPLSESLRCNGETSRLGER